MKADVRFATRRGTLRAALALPAVSASLVAIALLASPPSAAASPCPNESIRAEQGAVGLALPDCRAYEQVSPGAYAFQQSGSGPAEEAEAALDGNRIVFYSEYPGEEAESSGFYDFSTRGAGGWSVNYITPQDSPNAWFTANCQQGFFFNSDLSASILEEGLQRTPYCEHPEEELAPGEPHGYANVFRGDTASGSYQLVNVTPEGVTPANAEFVAGSSDLGHAVFGEEAKLTPEAPAGFDYYEWTGGTVRLLTFLPNGNPVSGRVAGARIGEGSPGVAPLIRSVSSDGERVAFYAEGNLYLRLNAAQPPSAVSGGECTEAGKACTIQVDASEGPGTSGGGTFWDASADGTRIFFTDASRLTTYSTSAAEKPDLYEYNLNAPEGERLTDLSANFAAPIPANVLGVLGASADGSYVYFVAAAVLTGEEENSEGAKAEESTKATKPDANLYLAHEGTLTYVATLAGNTAVLTEFGKEEIPTVTTRRVRLSPDGRFLIFNSRKSLTGYNSLPQTARACGTTVEEKERPCTEIFEYGAAAKRLACVSCNPSGAQPIDGYGSEVSLGTAGMKLSHRLSTPFQEDHHVFDNGRVFFNTVDPLVAADTNNGAQDLYEYELPGTGGCSEASPTYSPQDHGCLYLITAGQSPNNASFLAASNEGNDVFFVTSQPLLRSDTDVGNTTLYDARAGGGFPEPPPPPPCEGESCRGELPPPPGASSPATYSFQGSGNRRETRCKPGFVKRHGRCVKKHRKHKRRGHRRAARASRRAGK